MSTANREDLNAYVKEGQDYLDQVEPILVELLDGSDCEGFGEKVATVFRAFHSIKGVAGFLSLFRLQDFTHKAEEILDLIRNRTIEIDPQILRTLLKACDCLRGCFRIIEETGSDTGLIEQWDGTVAEFVELLGAYKSQKASPSGPALPLLSGAGDTANPGGLDTVWLLDFLKAPEMLATCLLEAEKLLTDTEGNLIDCLDKPLVPALLSPVADGIRKLKINARIFGIHEAVSLGGSLEKALRSHAGRSTPVASDSYALFFQAMTALRASISESIGKRGEHPEYELLKAELDRLSRPPATPVSEVRSTAAVSRSAAAGDTGTGSVKKGDLRVSLEKLDSMVALIEELGVVSGGLETSTRENGLAKQPEIAHIRGLADSLQRVALSVRLVPVSFSFRKMVRVVNDVSGKLGKRVALKIIGEQTELDRDMVEALSDPMVHLIRNALDHGLEMPEDRKAAGKDECGKVHLEAWHAGGEVIISLADDGRGISREKVWAKAAERGLVTGDGSAWDDEKIYALLFHPGFSLAREVTEFSGRGVGMDVVKKNIEALGGRVEIKSKLGHGTTFLIHLPNKSSLTESMLVRVADVKYAIRLSALCQSFRLRPGSVFRTPSGAERVESRGQIYPLIRLGLLHGIPGSVPDAEGIVILLENRGKRAALLVDKVLGRHQGVVKELSPLFGAIQGLSGSLALGMGSDEVCWVLDVNNFVAP